MKRQAYFVRLAALLATAVVLAAMLGCKSQVSGDVMATVDGRKIFRSDIDKYYENQVASAQQAIPRRSSTRGCRKRKSALRISSGISAVPSRSTR